MAGWSDIRVVKGQVIFKMSRAANLITQCIFYYLDFSHQLTHSSHPWLLSITAENPEITGTKDAASVTTGLFMGWGDWGGGCGRRCINWKTRKKSRGEEISQKNTSGRNRAGSNMKPCPNFLEQNFAPNSQGCWYFHVHPTCFQFLFLKLHKCKGKPANLKDQLHL